MLYGQKKPQNFVWGKKKVTWLSKDLDLRD